KRHSPLRPAPAVPVVRRGRAPRSRGGATPRGPGLPKAIRVDPPSTGVDRATRLTTEPIPREIAGTMTGFSRGLGRGTRGRGIGMIFQTFALYPHLTVHDNVAYPLREAPLDPAQIERRVGEVAELLRIGHTLRRRPATLTGGEQQRVAIGRAIIRRSKLLLLD